MVCAHVESTQTKVPQPFQARVSLQTHPAISVMDLRLTEPGAHLLMVVPASEEYPPRCSHPSRTSLLSKVIPTLFQDQFTAQGDPHTLPGPVYLSEYVLPPLWQNQYYFFTAIYTAIPHKAAYRQLHE